MVKYDTETAKCCIQCSARKHGHFVSRDFCYQVLFWVSADIVIGECGHLCTRIITILLNQKVRALKTNIFFTSCWTQKELEMNMHDRLTYIIGYVQYFTNPLNVTFLLIFSWFISFVMYCNWEHDPHHLSFAKVYHFEALGSVQLIY